jgi:hypothetical protein
MLPVNTSTVQIKPSLKKLEVCQMAVLRNFFALYTKTIAIQIIITRHNF